MRSGRCAAALDPKAPMRTRLTADASPRGRPSPEVRATTPVAVVANATLPNQSVQIGDLDSAEQLVAVLEGQPALVIVGEVVRLAEILAQAKSNLASV